MEIYNYHPITKYYLNTSIANESPLEPGVFLIPSNATTIKPPKPIDNKIPIWVNDHWELQDFESKYTVWDLNGNQTEYIGNINLLPDNLTQIKPPDDNNFYKFNGFEWIKDIERIKNIVRKERNRRINEIIWRIERYQSEIRQGLTPNDNENNISKIDNYIQQLRDLPTQEGFPWNGIDDPSCPWPELNI
jgi:hypothetical protein